MAIIIPSTNTYDRQNQKVRDNVIERIEVGAVEVVPDNEYETPVYNETIESGFEFYNSTISDNLFSQVDITGYAKEFWYAYYWISPQYIKNISIKIPKIKNNKWTNKIYTGVKEDKENESEEIPYIGVTIRATKETGTATGTYPLSGKPTTNYTKTEDYIGNVNPKKTYTYTHIISGSLASKSVTTPEKWVNEDNVNTATYSGDDNYYYLELTILCGYEEIGVGGYNLYGDPYMQTPTNISLSGECEKYTAYRVEITVYGNTIGIDLIDKTIYINGETQKKVHSVDGNELMQTNNYFLTYTNLIRARVGGELSSSNNIVHLEFYAEENLIKGQKIYFNREEAEIISLPEENGDPYTIKVKKDSVWELLSNSSETLIVPVYLNKNKNDLITNLYNKTISTYANGKETATIRCSISDYYDDEKKIIAIDNSTGKMSFDVGDKVIPMLYGEDGKDRPMSLDKNFQPKVFQVLGVKKFYDGAVWQELYLQET